MFQWPIVPPIHLNNLTFSLLNPILGYMEEALVPNPPEVKGVNKFLNDNLYEKFLQELTEGKSIMDICKQPNMPSIVDFQRHLMEDPYFKDDIRAIFEAQATLLLDKARSLAITSINTECPEELKLVQNKIKMLNQVTGMTNSTINKVMNLNLSINNGTNRDDKAVYNVKWNTVDDKPSSKPQGVDGANSMKGEQDGKT